MPNNPIPLLILSDAPTSGTGLGRITRDLATRIHANLQDVFRVGTFGYGGPYSRVLGFPQYSMDMENWIVHNLPEVWEDFASEEKGIVFTIWDSSRMLWFSRPENCPDPRLRKFLTNAPFQRFGYFPIDATGPHDKLTAILKHIIAGYNRVLAYSSWAARILERTFEGERKEQMRIDYLPHGIDTSVFFPRNRIQARHSFGHRLGAKNIRGKKAGQPVSIADDAFLVGIVATNQVRKDWGLGIATVAELAKERNVIVWIHTDILERHWSIPALLNDFGLQENAIVTIVEYSDEQMAWAYSALDCCLAIGLGEGFGFSAAEALACGVPIVAPDYGGGEWIPRKMTVPPVAWRLEGPYNCVRPVCDVASWKLAIDLWDKFQPHPVTLPEQLDWRNLWPRWEQWLRAGVK